MYWGPEDEADYQTPEDVRWENGALATLEDYRRNQFATRTTQATDKGNTTVIFPDVSSVTRFDSSRGHWIVEATNGDVLELLESDPVASDEALLTEISNNRVIYRTTIRRPHDS